MRKLFLAGALMSVVAVLSGCPKKTTDADAGDDGSAAAAAALAAIDAAAAPVAPVAKNAADIARFPAGEKPLTDDDQKIVNGFTQARSSPHAGSIVATLHVGTDPFKIAEFQDSDLVTFPDPKDPTATLMGWIPKTAFTAVVILDAGIRDAAIDVAVAPVLAGKCAAGQDLIVNISAVPVCRRKCTTDKDCKVQTLGACAAGSTVGGKITKVCANEQP